MWFLFGCVALMLLYSKFVYGIHQALVVCLPKSNTQYVWLFMYIFGYVISPYARHTTTTKKKTSDMVMNGLFLPKHMERNGNGTEQKWVTKIEWSGWIWPGQLADVCAVHMCLCLCVSRVERKPQVPSGVWSVDWSEWVLLFVSNRVFYCLSFKHTAEEYISRPCTTNPYVRDRSLCQFIWMNMVTR